MKTLNEQFKEDFFDYLKSLPTPVLTWAKNMGITHSTIDTHLRKRDFRIDELRFHDQFDEIVEFVKAYPKSTDLTLNDAPDLDTTTLMQKTIDFITAFNKGSAEDAAAALARFNVQANNIMKAKVQKDMSDEVTFK